MPVSVKVYYGKGSNQEIRRFMFRPELFRQPSGTSGSHIPQPAPGLFMALLDKIRVLYNGLNLHDVHLCWKDDDGDYVVFSSDDELKVALNCTTDNTLRIFIKDKDPKLKPGHSHRLTSEPVRRSDDYRDPSPQPGSSRDPYREREMTPTLRRRGEIVSEPAGVDLARAPSPVLVNHVVNQLAANSLQNLCSECQGEGRGVWYKCTVCSDFYLCSDCEHRGLHDQHIMVRTASGPSSYSQGSGSSFPR